MSMTDSLKAAGFKLEKSTEGDRPILKGIYRVMFAEGKLQEPNAYGHSYLAKFKVVATLSGKDSRSAFPEFAGFYDVAEKAADPKKGMAKLLNGFFSVGIKIDTESDEALYASLAEQVGSAELYVKGFEKKPWKKNDDGTFSENPEGTIKQDFNYMTKDSAEKQASAQAKKDGHPL